MEMFWATLKTEKRPLRSIFSTYMRGVIREGGAEDILMEQGEDEDVLGKVGDLVLVARQLYEAKFSGAVYRKDKVLMVMPDCDTCHEEID